jgi:hypothetical protein
MVYERSSTFVVTKMEQYGTFEEHSEPFFRKRLDWSQGTLLPLANNVYHMLI